MPRLWDPTPLHTTIVELLEKKGSSTDSNLYKELKVYHEELSSRTFNKTLMKLEIRGIIRVTSLTKNQRRVELVNTG
ncbi:MAG: transcriptional repressor [Candidatus Bathyarchaeia archaeon]